VVQMWSDIYRDHGEYILTGVGVERGVVRTWTDVPLQEHLCVWSLSEAASP
jgi:hypothetical protein